MIARNLEEALLEHEPFLDCDLTRRYLELVSKPFEGVGEKHHILPRSMFPQYVRCNWNIVNLSYKDHYEAHGLLKDCVEGEHKLKMVRAWWLVNRTSNDSVLVTAEDYAESRELRRIWMRGPGNPMYGRTHSDEVKQLLRERFTGTKMSEEQRTKMREVTRGENNGMYGKTQSSVAKQRMSSAKASYELDGELHTLNTLAAKYKISRAGLTHRLEFGMQLKDAITAKVGTGNVLNNTLLDAGFVFNSGVWYNSEDAVGITNQATYIVRETENIGSHSPVSKLNESDVLDIKTRLANKETQKSVAEKFSVSVGCIKHIAKGRTWRHVVVPKQLPASNPVETVPTILDKPKK